MDVALSSGYGYKRISAQVRDVRAFVSDTKFVVVQRVPLVVADTTAPVVSVHAPQSVPAASPTVRVAITASDAVGVTSMRFAREDGSYGAWESWSGAQSGIDLDLGAAPGRRVVFVQVQDAAFNVSEAASVVIEVVAPAAPSAPTERPASPGAVAPGIDVPPAVAAGAAAARRDSVAPVLTALRAPARSCARAITLRLAARDDVRVVRIRVANEDGRFGAWKPYRASVAHRLTSGSTVKRITVQVADAAGNVSASRSVRVTVQRCR